MMTGHVITDKIFPVLLCLSVVACNSEGEKVVVVETDSAHSCMNVPARFANPIDTYAIKYSNDTSFKNMVLIPGGVFEMGGDNNQASPDEYPKHTVEVAAFYMDISEVTNAQFKKFADATGYITTAEKKPDWEE